MLDKYWWRKFLATFTVSLPLLSWSNWWKREDADDEVFEEDLNTEGESLKYPEELLGELLESPRLKLELDWLEVDLLDIPDELEVSLL